MYRTADAGKTHDIRGPRASGSLEEADFKFSLMLDSGQKYIDVLIILLYSHGRIINALND